MALYGERLYFGTADNQLVALDARSGEEVWNTPTGPTSGGPIAVNGKVIEGLFRGERMPPHPGDPLAAKAQPGQPSLTKCVTCGGFGRIVGLDAAGGKLPKYGKLANRSLDEMIAGAPAGTQARMLVSPGQVITTEQLKDNRTRSS